ncbi:MAG: tetratricopeptide repeat protein [Rikenellaceae bacterium]
MDKKMTGAEDPEEVIELALDLTESYIEKHFKKLIIAVVAIILVTGSYFGYDQLIRAPRYEKASAAAFVAEQYFQQDSFALALNGAEDFEGFLSIADNYSSTPTGNVANHYAGICYLQLGELDNALSALQSYSQVNGKAADIINAQNVGLVGDIMVQKGEVEKSISYYEKAAAFLNDFSTPIYLKKLGLTYEALGNSAKAVETYQRIVNEYSSSMEARDIEKFIGRAEK